MKKICITGVSIVGNRGAEAMLTATIGRIRDKYPDAFFTVLSIYPGIDKKLVHDEKIKIINSTPFFLAFVIFPLSTLLSFFFLLRICSAKHLFPETIKNIANSDILIDLSGVSFIDTRLKFLPYNILLILPAILLGVPVVKGAQAMGPFSKRLNRMAANIFLSRCRMLFARGRYTVQHLDQIGFSRNKIAIASDIAFLYKDGDALSQENVEYLRNILSRAKEIKKAGNILIGICPSAVLYSYSEKSDWDYISFLNRIIRTLVAEGHKVLLFPNATRQDRMDKFKNNDLPIIRKIVEANKSHHGVLSNILYIDKDLNTSGIRSFLTMLDVALVSRFHAMVACLSLAVPLLVIGWSHKYLEVMELFKMEDWVFDYRDSNDTRIDEKIFELIEQKVSLSDKIDKKLGNVQKLSALQIDYICAFLADKNDVQ